MKTAEFINKTIFKDRLQNENTYLDLNFGRVQVYDRKGSDIKNYKEYTLSYVLRYFLYYKRRGMPISARMDLNLWAFYDELMK